MIDKRRIDIHDDQFFIDDFNKDQILFNEEELKREKEKESHFKEKYKKAVIKGNNIKRRKMIKDMNKRFHPTKVKESFNMLQTTKKIMIFLILNCLMVEFYSMYVMYELSDISALYSLIAAVITESISFLAYCAKSYLETKSEKNHELELKKLELPEPPTEDECLDPSGESSVDE